MQQSECGTQKQPTPHPGEGTAPRAEPKKRIRNKKSFNFINVAAKFRPGHNAAGGTAEKLCLASEKWTANCASGRGREEREGGEKFKMLTVRLSFSAGPGPVPVPGPGPGLGGGRTAAQCVQNSPLLALANEATDNGDRRKGKKLKIAL